MLKLLDFYADWCGPCQIMGPILESVEGDYEGKVEFEKVDVEQDAARAQKFGVQGIPTFVLVEDEKEIARRTGAMPAEVLKEWLDSNL